MQANRTSHKNGLCCTCMRYMSCKWWKSVTCPSSGISSLILWSIWHGRSWKLNIFFITLQGRNFYMFFSRMNFSATWLTCSYVHVFWQLISYFLLCEVVLHLSNIALHAELLEELKMYWFQNFTNYSPTNFISTLQKDRPNGKRDRKLFDPIILIFAIK